ncbi:serine hydrolase domain-containing protein [Streptomyces chiangmaiensis]|uniref:Serine hydrolase domain-containing protein n=1 Tax=Streptomyces chiangmaiensis TaxID=766497 RepID=A0ABU7FE91_9ACTN|nr:serine hydrolase domain-containing protein [Streptomyces chiangmaiensis]MED7821454.1 serine hydrolase domain-containing protein [Streptomyces chiangmaiensis]
MSTRPLPVSTPAEQGVDARGIQAFLDVIEAAPDIEPHSLMILRHGRLVASGWWAPYTADRLHLLYSLSKSFTSTAAGVAVAEGLLDLDAPVISYFPEFEADITDPRSRAMLVRHIASMASGHLAETNDEAFGLDRAEPVRGFLLIPPDRDPGTVFAYNQPTTYTLAALVQRLSGRSLTEYLRPRILDPLGIGEVAWTQHPRGRDLGFSGLHATTDAIARLGLLYLQDGVWEGRRLLPSSWVAGATRSHISNADGTAEGAASDWQQGYGFQFWMSRHGYRGDGAYGQFCVVLPEHDTVIATTAATEQMQKLLDAMWRHLLPALGPGPLAGRAEEDKALQDRLDRLTLPPVAAHPGPAADPGPWQRARFTPRGGHCANQPTLTRVEVARADGAWTATLVEGEERLALRLPDSGWAVDDGTVPRAVSGGWTAQDTLHVDIVFLETPHRLTVTCALDDGTFTARWHTTPLHVGPLRRHRAPLTSREGSAPRG